MNRVKVALFTAIFIAAAFLVSCGDFFDDFFGHEGAIVEPLLQTRWNQSSPYGDMLPPNDGYCAIVAKAQLMKYYKHPARGRGESGPWEWEGVEMPSVNFEIDYDWDNMLNSYNGSESEQQKNAVATLIYHIAANNKADVDSIIARWSRGYVAFEYRPSHNIPRKGDFAPYDEATFEAILKQQLDNSWPVEAGIVLRGIPHAVIVDGYDNAGKFHINCGGGIGWYFLDDKICGGSELTNMIFNERPDKGGAGYEIGLMTPIVASKTSISQNEIFLVKTSLTKLRDNNGELLQGGSFGAALVDNSGNIVEVIGSVNHRNARGGLRSATFTIASFVPETVRSGQYSLMAVAKPVGGEWKIVESAFNGIIPDAIDFTVAAGETMEVMGDGYGLALENFTASKTSASQNESFTVNYTLSNVTSDNFSGGEAGVALVDNNGSIKAVVGSKTLGTINAYRHSVDRVPISSAINCSVPATVPPGQYQLRMVVKPTNGEWRAATLTIGYSNPNHSIGSWFLESNVPNSISFVIR
jgi:hypothetical protein